MHNINIGVYVGPTWISNAPTINGSQVVRLSAWLWLSDLREEKCQDDDDWKEGRKEHIYLTKRETTIQYIFMKMQWSGDCR